MKMGVAQQRFQSGQGLAELLCGMTILVLVALFLIDLFALAVGASFNDELAKRAARAAASKASGNEATVVVDQVRRSCPTNGIVEKVNTLRVSKFDARPGGGVRVRSVVSIRLPIPVPFCRSLGDVSFRAEAEEPIVGLEARAM
jgi:hypothetical protein